MRYMADPTRIYLDNAATSWPKPETVYAAVDDYQRRLGAPLGRGIYAEADQVQRAVQQARHALARLIGCEDPRHVVFTFNATDALNMALHGLLRPGDHVVTSVVEHNSVLRPLRNWEDQGDVEVTRVECDAEGVVDAQQILDALRPDTRLVALAHASNVTGAIQPVAEVGEALRDHSALFLVDAAQTLGHVPIDVAQCGIDLLASSGHKGLLGPLGTGLLYVRPGVEAELRSFRQGGTGSRSEDDRQPDSMPDKYESGNQNVAGLVGLAAGVQYIAERTIDDLADHARQLTGRLIDGLQSIDGVQIHGPRDLARRVGVVSMTIEGYDPQEVAALLESAYRIQVRPGLHCAPLMHRALGTLPLGGTVRLSSGPFNTPDEIDAAIAALTEIAAAAISP